MYIIVVGGGRVGYYLTKALLDEGHEVLVLEKNAAVCAVLNEELGSVCLRGDGCESTVLAAAGAGRADMLAAVTGDDEDNLVACQVAKHMFHVPRTIARIRNPKNERIFKELGIDVTVNNTNIILENIEEEVPTHPLTHLRDIRGLGLGIVEIKIPENAPTIGRPLKELPLPENAAVALVIRRKTSKPILASGNTAIQPEDIVIAVTPHEDEEALRAALRGE